MSQSGKKKGLNWISEEIELLLNEIEKILPMCANEWELVAKNYNIARLNPLSGVKDRPERQRDSCKIKFKAMKNVKKPTGDPTIPADVKRAKQIQKKIVERMPSVHGDDTDEAANGTLMQYARAEYHDNAQGGADDEVTDRAGCGAPAALAVAGEALAASAVARTGATQGTMSQPSAKRARLDARIDAAEDGLADGRNMMQLYMMEAAAARREDRIRQELRDEERQRREDDRQRRQEEREDRNQQMFAMMFSSGVKLLERFLSDKN